MAGVLRAIADAARVQRWRRMISDPTAPFHRMSKGLCLVSAAWAWGVIFGAANLLGEFNIDTLEHAGLPAAIS